QHLFVGSGVIEAGCKTVIASRFKRSGMFWSLRGANSILALRCSYLNARFGTTGRAAGRLSPHNSNFYVAHRLQLVRTTIRQMMRYTHHAYESPQSFIRFALLDCLPVFWRGGLSDFREALWWQRNPPQPVRFRALVHH